MPVISGIIDDYNTAEKRKRAAEAAALKRVAALICIEAENRPPAPLQVIDYPTPPTPAESDNASAERLRKTVHAIVDKMLGLK